jgi:hypothetical protein
VSGNASAASSDEEKRGPGRPRTHRYEYAMTAQDSHLASSARSAPVLPPVNGEHESQIEWEPFAVASNMGTLTVLWRRRVPEK